MRAIKTEHGYRRETWWERNSNYVYAFLCGVISTSIIFIEVINR